MKGSPVQVRASASRVLKATFQYLNLFKYLVWAASRERIACSPHATDKHFISMAPAGARTLGTRTTSLLVPQIPVDLQPPEVRRRTGSSLRRPWYPFLYRLRADRRVRPDGQSLDSLFAARH